MNAPSHKLMRTLVLAGASLTSAMVGCGGQVSGPQGGPTSSPGSPGSTSSSASGSTPSYAASTTSTQVMFTIGPIDASAGVDARAAADAALDAADAADVSYSIIYPGIR